MIKKLKQKPRNPDDFRHRVIPTAKQQKLVHEFLKTGNKSQSAMRVFNMKNKIHAGNYANMTLKKPHVQTYMQQVLDAQGMDEKAIGLHLRKIIKAGTSDEALLEAKPSDALNAIKEVAKMKDLYPAERKEIRKATLNVDVKNKSEEEIKMMLDELVKEVQEFKRLQTK